VTEGVTLIEGVGVVFMGSSVMFIIPFILECIEH